LLLASGASETRDNRIGRLHCFDWTNTTIPDDAPKIMEHGVYTPNGTATVHRNLTHFVKPEKHWWLPLYRPKGKNLTDWMVTLDG